MATSIEKINQLLALAAQDNEEGRTVAFLAARHIKEGGYVLTRPGSKSTRVTEESGIPDKEKIDRIFPAVVEGGLLLMSKGLRATKEGMIDVYERALNDKLDYATRVCLLSRLHAKFLKYKGEGYVVTLRGGGGGYELAPGVRYKNGKFYLWPRGHMIALVKVPHDIARILSDVPVEGELEAEGDYHITLVYFDDGLSNDQMFKAAQVIHEAVAEVYGPIQIAVNQVTSFPADPSGKSPVIARVQSPVLELLRQKIVTALDSHDIPYSKKHPEFKPHVTLSYVQGNPPSDFSIPNLQWGCAEIFLWGGSWGDHSFSVCYPISAPPPSVAVASIYRQALFSVIQNAG